MAGTQASESDRHRPGRGGPSAPTRPTGTAEGKQLLRRLDLEPPRSPGPPALGHTHGERKQVLTELEHRRSQQPESGHGPARPGCRPRSSRPQERDGHAGQGRPSLGRETDTQAMARGAGGRLQLLPTAPENAFSWEPACLPLALSSYYSHCELFGHESQNFYI